MPFFVIPSRRTRQPQGPVRLNASHPLAPWLLMGWSGQAAANLAGSTPVSLEANASLVGSRQGLAVSNSSTTSGGVTVGSTLGYSGSAFTAMVFTEAIASVATNATLFSVPHSASWVAPYAPIIFRRYGAAANRVSVFIGQADATFAETTGTLGAHQLVSSSPACHWVVANGSTVSFGIDRTTTSSGHAQTKGPDFSSARRATIFGAPPLSNTEGITGTASAAFFFRRALTDSERADVIAARYALFAPDQRRLYFGAGAGGDVVTESASGRLRARGSETSAPVRAEVVTARSNARGVATTTAIKVEAVVARRKARATDSTSAIRTESVVCRVKARSTTTVVHIDAGAVVQPVAGRRQVRASVTATPIRTEAIVARRQARASDTVTLTRTESVGARRKARGAVTAAPVVAGMITEAVAGRLRARGGATVTTTRVEAVSARRKARGSAVINGIRAALAAGRARLRAAVAGAPYVAPVTLSVDPRYLVPARGRHFTACARGRRFVART